jgi:putative SOS response-associated peptidase YedK
MCVQFTIKRTGAELINTYKAGIDQDFEWKPHVFPKYPAPVLIDKNSERKIVQMNFGFIPFFEKNEKPKMIFHNARSETLKEKASFKKAYLEKRCLIPLDHFFEYVPGAHGKKTLVKFYPTNGKILTALGIYNLWKSPRGELIPTFSMITRDPPPFILEIGHDRCPYFFEERFFDEWLNPQKTTYEALDALMAKGKADIDFEVEKA